MTKFTQKSFTVGGSSKAYSDNYDSVFRREPEPAPSECKPGFALPKADIHYGSELKYVYTAGVTHSKFKAGTRVEVYECVDCGDRWEV
jgi:hypothetical protein